MTILAAAQNAIMQLVGSKPAAVVSSTDTICVEITALAHEAAVDIATAYDWQKLIKFHTITGTGTSTAFPFPADYDRMVQASEIFDPDNWCWGYNHITSPSDWLFYENNSLGLIPPGIWTVREDQFHFLPVPPAGAKAVFPYITRSIFVDANGAPKDQITADSDSFVLNERLLTLSLIWRYKAMKGLDYQQDMENFNVAMDRATANDRGARQIHRENGPHPMKGIRTAYPWPLDA
ncbi:MAG TPA: hypothetical protein VIK82_05915 [Porticoccaceae bacterium]